MDDRYDRVYYHSKLMDKMTRDAVIEMEKDLGYDLTITQGCYNDGKVAASAGTHDGGGVLDLAPADASRKVLVARKHGFAAYHRTRAQGFPEHVHIIQINNARLSDEAKDQVYAYKHGDNALAPPHDGPDDGPDVSRRCWPTFDYTDKSTYWKP